MAYWFHLQFGRRAGRPRRDLLRREPAGRGLVAVGRADRGPDRPDQHDGLHPPAVERAADPRPADAEPPAGGRGAAAAVQPQPDGRADAAVVRDGGRRPGRAIGRGRRDRHRADDRRGDLAGVLVGAGRERRLAAVPFYLAGGLKILYDLLLYREFRSVAARGATRPAQAVRLARVAGRRRPGSARHPEAPPDEAATTARRRPPRSRGRTAGGRGGCPPSSRPGRAGVDQQDRPGERAGGRVDDELAERHPGDAGREADERPDDRQQPADEHGRRCRALRRTGRRARSRAAGSAGTCP